MKQSNTPKSETQSPAKPKQTRRRDLIGLRFGRLTVISKHHKNPGQSSSWECLCDCGKTAVVFGSNLTSGRTNSCGCLLVENGDYARTHGASRTPAYHRWAGMLDRCRNPRNKHWASYGGRGIEVCEEWMHFENFLADMGQPPSGHSIDRIDNNRGYEPGNCRWASPMQQANNTRRNVMLEFEGRTQTASQWARELGYSKQLLLNRLHSGWSVTETLTTPAKGKRS